MRTIKITAISVLSVGLVAGSVLGVAAQEEAAETRSEGTPASVTLSVPDGYEAGVFASGLDGPRFMAVAPDGTLFVAERGLDRVVALPDADQDGRADATIEVGSGYDQAHSVAFADDGSLLVAGSGTLFRVTVGPDRTELSREAILQYAAGGQNSTRTVVVAPDDSLLVSVGSSCNICTEEAQERAAIITASPDGGEWQVLMRGLRNAVGVAVDPATGDAWTTVMGTDGMGDDMPPETLYRVVDGAHAGWPRCHAGETPDPEFGDVPDPRTGQTGCEGVSTPDATFQAHMAPLGVAFWDGGLAIAFHGSRDRPEKVGYEVWWLPWDDGPSGVPVVLASGFIDAQTGEVGGRPAGLVVGADGALYISDDFAGHIYRVDKSS